MSWSQARRRAVAKVLAVPLVIALAACGSSGDAGGSGAAPAGEPIRVGVPTSLTGVFGIYGNMIKEGMEAGLACATGGTGQVNGRRVELVFEDDAGDPAKALTAATGMVGRGVNIIAGTTSSGISAQLGEFAAQNDALFISGAAGADNITGLNKNTFRSSRQAYQESAALASLLGSSNGKVVAVAQDYAFGQGYVKTLETILGGMGAKVESVLVPLDAKEFTPFARQIVQSDPDLVVVIYYGQTTAGMWQSLQQQGVLEGRKVATLLVEKANWSTYGKAAEDAVFVSHYFPGAAKTPLNDCLVERVPNADLSTHDGFVTALMGHRALTTAGPDDVPGMIKALEGWSFDAPKGKMTIRAGDHAMIQDMFVASLTGSGDADRQAKLVGTVPADQATPPEQGG